MIIDLRELIFLTVNLIFIHAQSFQQLKFSHLLGDFNNGQIRHLALLQNDEKFKEDLGNILIPRVVGTQGHESVYNYIKSTLENLDYHVRIDEFTDKTPFGNLTFKNIIATLNPKAERFFVVAAHYDSKYFPNGQFVGATDSAVPCAMILELARVFKTFDFSKKNELSLKIVFFDGEEAFVQWGPKDSIYGARHLADKLQQKRSRSKLTNEIVTDLQRIDCLMLLDLLGYRNPTIHSYFRDTQNLFSILSNSEKKLNELGLLKRENISPIFISRSKNAFIEDDHVPFLKRNVRILHIIPVPFPDAWHTLNDDANILDMDTIHDMSLSIQLFVARYLHASTIYEGKTTNGLMNRQANNNIMLCLFVMLNMFV